MSRSGSSRPYRMFSRIVPENELQDKSERGYFGNTMRLEEGELFVSPMDLNVEHGAIEEPYTPVVRLATPIAAGGQRRGIVVLNAHGRRFLGAFERAADETGVGLRQLEEGLLRPEVGHRDRLHAPVRAAPTKDGQVEHQYTPSTTVALSWAKGRTLRTPSQG